MSLLRLLHELKALEEELSITDPTDIEGAVAFLVTGDNSQALGRAQAVFENFPEVNGDEGRIGSFLETLETIRIRFTAFDGKLSRAEEIAVAYYDALKSALDAQRPFALRLNGSFDNLTIRAGNGGPFGVFDDRIGFELLCDFQIFKTAVTA